MYLHDINVVGGFTKPVHLSPELSKFMGMEMCPRTEVTKYIWKYIKENNLQNPADKRVIMCNDALELLFKRKSINFMKMTGVLS